MKNIMKNRLGSTAILTVFLLFTTCDKSIDIPGDNENAYQTSNDSFAYIINEQGKRTLSFVEFRNEGTTNVYVALSKAAPSDVQGNFKYSPEALKNYNSAQETDYEAFPQELIEFTGAMQIAKGAFKSNKISIQLKTNDALDPEKTYVIPLQAELNSGDVQLAQNGADYLIFVKDLSKRLDPTKIPDPDKYPYGIKIIHLSDINNTTNPLNNLCFRLKNSGKHLIDVVVLFSSNINWNADEGRVYVYNNKNIQHILDHRDKYLKPLQDAGIKVILCITGNHDHTGIYNLSDETAKDYAQELKAVCDAYHLDGVCFDDEYTRGRAPKGYTEGFTTENNVARLLYETKQAMPDRLVISYVLGNLSSRSLSSSDSGKVSGHPIETFIDYAVHNYRVSTVNPPYNSMPISHIGIWSQEFERGVFASEVALKELRNDGYGVNMIFAMDPNRGGPNDPEKEKHRGYWLRQYPRLKTTAKALFDDTLEIYGADGVKMDDDAIDQSKFYKKDW